MLEHNTTSITVSSVTSWDVIVRNINFLFLGPGVWHP